MDIFIPLFLSLFRIFNVGGEFGVPDFESDWHYMEAQVLTQSKVDIAHSLGELPRLVEVLVKVQDSPNENFIFKAIGNGERDDDSPNTFGAVMYVYNEVNVRVVVPCRYNQYATGLAWYTGDTPYWTGPNVQSLLGVYVKARCWLEDKLPVPCFTAENIDPTDPADNGFFELSHGQGSYPSLVKVRVLIQNGGDSGYYSEAMGTSMISFDANANSQWVSGIKFAYNNATIRIWTTGRIVYSRADGWGGTAAATYYATTGTIDVFAICNNQAPTLLTTTFPLDPAINGAQLEVELPREVILAGSETFVYIQVEATSGPNEGFLFDAVGGAMTNTMWPGTPCQYGGLNYAYSNTTLRFWKPDHATGAAVCISSIFGGGQYTQAVNTGVIHISIKHLLNFTEIKAEPYVPPISGCSKFVLLGNGTAYNATSIKSEDSVTSLTTCDYNCRQIIGCETFVFDGNTNDCHLYNVTDRSLLYSSPGFQVWTVESMCYSIDKSCTNTTVT